MKLLVAAAVSLLFPGILGGSARAWDYVWGDPGPSNYSLYKNVALANDGSTYVVGLYSGNFHGLKSPRAYRYFIQRIEASGNVDWTNELDFGGGTTLGSEKPEVVIDGNGLIFVYGHDVSLSVWNQNGDLVASREPEGSSRKQANQIVPFASGGVAVLFGTRVVRLDAALDEVWSYQLTGFTDLAELVELAVGPDDTVWAVNDQFRPLPTSSDALIMRHLTPGGEVKKSIKHYGFRLAWAGSVRSIVGVSSDTLWIDTSYGWTSFSAEDGKKLANISDPPWQIGPYTVCYISGSDRNTAYLAMNGSRMVALYTCEQGPEGGAILMVDQFVSDTEGKIDQIISWKNLDNSFLNSPALAETLAIATNNFGESVVVGGSTVGKLFAFSKNLDHTSGNVSLWSSTTRAMAAKDPLGSLYFGLRSAGERTEISIAGRFSVPRTAQSVSLSITASLPWAAGSLTLWPCDQPRPNASSVTFMPGKNATNTVVSSLSDDGKVCVYNTAATHLIVDVIGRGSDDSDYVALQPARLLDTLKPGKTVDRISAGIGRRTASSVTELKVAGRGRVGAEADAVALNVSALVPSGNGFVTIYPCGSKRPAQESVSYSLWQSTTNMVISKVGTGGKVCLYTSASTDLQVDAIGYVDSGSTFKSLSPARLLDSRADSTRTTDGKYWKIGRRAANSVTQLEVSGRGRVASGASTVVLNVAAINPNGAGSLKVYQCGIKTPNAISVSYSAGTTTRTSVFTRVGVGGKVCIKTSQALDISVDVVAYSDANSSFQALRPARVVNTAVK